MRKNPRCLKGLPAVNLVPVCSSPCFQAEPRQLEGDNDPLITPHPSSAGHAGTRTEPSLSRPTACEAVIHRAMKYTLPRGRVDRDGDGGCFLRTMSVILEATGRSLLRRPDGSRLRRNGHRRTEQLRSGCHPAAARTGKAETAGHRLAHVSGV